MPTEANFPVTGSFSSLGAEAHEWALCLVIGSYDAIFTNHSDTSGLTTAWAAASDWNTVYGGLETPGGVQASMSPFSSQIEMQGMSFSIVDTSNIFRSIFQREASSAAVSERLALVTTASLDSNDTIIFLNNSSSFPSSGTAYLGATEEVTYTTNSGSGLLLGVTRGVRSLFGTSSDSDNFGRPHAIDFDGIGVAPVVSTHPRMLIGREVALYLCTKIAGTWTAGLQGSGTTTAAECLWAGRIQSFADDGTGRIALECASILEKLKGNLLSKQFKAYLDEGVYFTAATDGHFRVRLDRRNSAGTLDRDAPAPVSIIAADGYYSHSEIAALINEQLATWFDGSGTTFPSTATLSLDFVGDRYEFSYVDSGANYSSNLAIDMSEQMWTVLGPGRWNGRGLSNDRRTGEFPTLLSASLPTFDASEGGTIAADAPPSDVAFTIPPGDTGTYSLRVRDVTGGTEFVTQPAGTMPPGVGDATGFLRIGKVLVPVSVSGTNVFTAYGGQIETGFSAANILGLETIGNSNTVENRDAVKQAFLDARTEEGVLVEQVWFEITPNPGDLFLKLMVSTGTSAYNHATYDVYGRSMGLGLPWTLIDGEAFLEAFPFAGWILYLDKPTQFLQLLETLLAVSNRRVVWRRGRITIVGFGEDATGTVTLTEANKAKQVTSADEPVIERCTVRRTMDYLINRATLRHSFNVGTGQWKSITVNGSESQSDFGISKGVTVDGIGVYDGLVGFIGALDTWTSQVASAALSYFGRPLALIERSFDVSLLGSLYPGCKVLLDDDGITDPVTGEAGVSGLRCWCIAVSFDLRSGVGRVVLAFAPEVAQTRHGLLGPSARVDETVGSGGFTNGYNSGTKTLAIKAHEFSGSSDSVDVSWFNAGRKVRVVSLSAWPSSEMWADEVASIDTGNSRMTLVTGLTGFPASGYFVVEFDDIDNVIASQRSGFVYLANSLTRSTGYADNDEYVYSGARQLHSEGSSTTPTYTNRYRKLSWNGETTITGGDAVGEAFSVHKPHEMLDFGNTALGNFTAQPVFIYTATTTSESVNTGAGTSGDSLILGPVWVPLYGGNRSLKIVAYGASEFANEPALASTIRVISSTGIVRGTATGFDNDVNNGEPLVYPDGGVNYVDITLNAAHTFDYSSEGTLTPTVVPGDPPGCWLTVQGQWATGDNNYGALLRMLLVYESALT